MLHHKVTPKFPTGKRGQPNRVKLDANTIAGLTLPDGKDDHIFWDDDLPGFGYRLNRSKGRTNSKWIIQYRTNRGCSRRMTIGPGTLAPVKARKHASELLAKVKLGEDPAGTKSAERQRGSKTLRGLVEEFIDNKSKAAKPWREGTERQYRYILFTYFKPLLHKEADAITRVDIAPVFNRIERERGLRSRVLARTRLMTLYRWAMGEGLVESNPVIGTRKVEYDVKRERVLSDDELVKIWNACDPKYFPYNANFGRIVRLLILTGARRKEIAAMHWSEFDLDKGTWTLPGTRSKNHHALTLQLPPTAVTIIKEVEQLAEIGNSFRKCLFSREGKMNLARHKEKLEDRSGVKGWWLHDLRRTAATGMANIGIAPHIIECVLNHRSGFRAGVGGIYNRSSYEREMTQALARWNEHVLALVEGRDDKIITLRA